jgi:tellurite resistance protein TehA-like permease
LLSGMGSIWALLALIAMIEKAWQGQLKWNMSWNSIIFPTGTLTTSFLLFSTELDSPAFRAITTGMVILLVVVFVLNLAFACWKISRGELLIVRRNPRAGHDD